MIGRTISQLIGIDGQKSTKHNSTDIRRYIPNDATCRHLGITAEEREWGQRPTQFEKARLLRPERPDTLGGNRYSKRKPESTLTWSLTRSLLRGWNLFPRPDVSAETSETFPKSQTPEEQHSMLRPRPKKITPKTCSVVVLLLTFSPRRCPVVMIGTARNIRRPIVTHVLNGTEPYRTTHACRHSTT